MTYLYDKLLTGFLLHKKEDIVPPATIKIRSTKYSMYKQRYYYVLLQ